MRTEYVVTCASQTGDYCRRVCDILNNDKALRKGNRDAEQRFNAQGVYGTDEDTTISVHKESKGEFERTSVKISREFSETIEETECKIINARTHLTSILAANSLVLH